MPISIIHFSQAFLLLYFHKDDMSTRSWQAGNSSVSYAHSQGRSACSVPTQFLSRCENKALYAPLSGITSLSQCMAGLSSRDQHPERRLRFMASGGADAIKCGCVVAF